MSNPTIFGKAIPKIIKSEKSKMVVQQINYIDGIPWGKYYEWWPNGIKKIDGTYRSGYMHGRWKFFFDEGLPRQML